MPNHIIPLKRIETGDRITGGSRFPGRPGTTRRGQASRLGPKLDRAFSDILDRADFDVAADPQALAPERVLVFEIIGQVANFAAMARRVGLEWLAERLASLEGVEAYATPDEDDDRDEDDDETADPDVAGDPEPARPTAGRFYMAAPTRASFEKLRDLWDRYKSGEKHPDNFSDWWRLFDRLHDLRPWGPQDRVPDATSRFIEVELARDPERELTVEIEVWFYDDGDFRRSQAKRIEIEIEDLGGEVLDTAEIEAIQYNAILARLPAAELESLAGRDGPLATSQPIMTIRPQSMFRAPPFEDSPLQSPEAPPPGERDARPSYAALLDGFPVQNHILLRNRLDIIELDVDEDSAPLARRVHGTAMSSIILHGDLEKQEPPISRVLKVVPILAPDEDGFEAPPRDRLILKTIFEAIEHLKEGRGDEEPSGRDVILVNHSLCDEGNPFAAGAVSAWGRALDHLSYKYKILFVASAGNIQSTFPLAGFASVPALQGADPVQRRDRILLALEASKASRGILAPAESVNALTVGAAHADGATTAAPQTVVDPYGTLRMSNLGSALGLGFTGSVKPDLIVDGGRQSAMPSGNPMVIHGFEAPAFFGQLAACPDQTGRSLAKTRRSSGTSNAAAMTTRAGLLVADALDEAFSTEAAWHRRATAACMVKALIAHAASWQDVGDALDGVLPPAGGRGAIRRRENIARYIGYGGLDLARIISGGENRATLLADDFIRVNQRHTYFIPLPEELASRPEPRRVTVTLAWLSPVMPNHANYRVAALDLVADNGSSALWSGVARRKGQPPVYTSRKGTLLHAVYEGRNPVPFAAGSGFRINVQASSRSKGWSKEDIPYALAVTFEALTDVNVDVYRSIEARVRPRVRTR